MASASPPVIAASPPSPTILFPSTSPGTPKPRPRRLVTAASARAMPWPHVLTVAGSDSGVGAGIQADIKACAALGAYCSSVITAVRCRTPLASRGSILFRRTSSRSSSGKELIELRGQRIQAHNTHGTGCTLASCITAELAKGATMLHAVQAAKKFLESALCHIKDLVIGNGPQGPFDHFFRLKSPLYNMGSLRIFNPDDLFLYAVTDSGVNKKWGRSIEDAVQAAIEGGATIVQLREKDAETREFSEAAKACMDICRSKGVPLLSQHGRGCPMDRTGIDPSIQQLTRGHQGEPNLISLLPRCSTG